jgi:predicted exporter
MDTTNTITIIIAVIVLLVIGGLLGMLFTRRQRTKRLQERFGLEYDRTVKAVGDQRQAESELEARLGHVKALEIRPLAAEESERFTNEWRAAQAEFVDEPLASVQKANRLIKEVMNAKGYPVDDFEQRAADISVDYPDLVIDYRELRAIATKGEDEEVTTEEMRQAMVHARALFQNLVQPEAKVADTDQKEKM